MTPEQLAEKILQALTALVDDGTITVDGGLPGELKVERPKNPEHGDYATNVAMQLGKRSGMPPRQFAELLAAKLTDDEAITAVEIAGPGFINIRVAADAQGKIAASIVEAGPQYGSSDSLKGQAINLEFISANPTGPLHLGHTRWAALGDAIARVLIAAGAKVTREFYVNDRGAQMDKFGASLQAAAHGVPPKRHPAAARWCSSPARHHHPTPTTPEPSTSRGTRPHHNRAVRVAVMRVARCLRPTMAAKKRAVSSRLRTTGSLLGCLGQRTRCRTPCRWRVTS